MSIVVDYAIENANVELETALTTIKDQVPYGNSFLGYGKLCRMMEVKQLSIVNVNIFLTILFTGFVDRYWSCFRSLVQTHSFSFNVNL